MKPESETFETACRRDEIAAYLDGELSPGQELDLEEHFSDCAACLDAFNFQKDLLFALDSVLDPHAGDLEVPENFSRVVSVNAESNISGIRSPQERFRAVFVCAALVLAAIFSLGGEAGNMVAAVQKIGIQTVAVLGFISHLFFEIGIGAAVVLRCVGQGMIYGSGLTLSLSVTAFAIASVALSKLILGNDGTS